MAQHVQLRRDTAAAWTAANSLLANGEIGLETDTHKFKIGDGVTAWNSLGYASAIPSGGTTGQALKKASNADFDLSWGSVATSISDITGLGTGVATALAVNVGTAGAPVINGGALGTPSGGTLTNCTFPTLNQNTSGTAAGLSATLAIASGGTNLTSYTAGDILYCSATNVLSKLAKGSDTQVLTLASGLPSWATPGASGAGLGANTFTALQTITQASANTGILASTGYSLTGSNATNMIDLAGTWNTSGAPSALKLNITNTASSGSSRILDLQVNSSLIAALDPTGTFFANRFRVLGAGTAASPAFALISTGGSGLYGNGGGGGTEPVISCASTAIALFTTTTNSSVPAVRLKSTALLGWSTGDPTAAFEDVALGRNAAGVVEVNSGTAGTFRDLKLRNLISSGGVVTLASFTVATLPSASTSGAGATAFVTDASTTLVLGLGTTVSGSGSNKVPVYSDATNWLYG